MMSMDAIVAELNAHLTDAARDVINAAQTILKGNQDDIRNLCSRWGVQLKRQKRYRPMETIKQELKTALTRRAAELKSGTDASVGGAATEHAETTVRADAALTDTLRSGIQHAAGSTASEHASAEFCLEGALAETQHRITGICGDSEILVRIVDHACNSEQSALRTFSCA